MTEHSDPLDWPALLTSLLDGRALAAESTAWAMDQVMRGQAAPAQLAGLLVALRAKGETPEEVLGLVRSMHAHAVRVDIPGPALDIVGTGGDGSDSVNISTMAAIVAAGAGARVVKHGNRSASSACGSADVLEELGVPLHLAPEAVAQLATEVGITFCFAPVFHPAVRHAAPVRRELGVRTIFNCLGPLTNPAAPTALAVGVADPALAPVVARTLALRGVSALVFRGDDGMDELTVTTTSRVWSVHEGGVREESFDPRDVGIPFAPARALRGGGPRHNADVVRAVLAGERGAVRDAVLLSAAAGLAALEASTASTASGQPVTGTVTERIAAGLARAARAVDSGAAADVLHRWVAVAGKLSGTTG
ncbi:anthranilate phosphoribosyltransferase [Streptomyces viridochromogenes]|uniref:Anthranilate phosphoribosyltransferase n=1 Tax=Streptomyces viridochromogenes Tue57 TaxID=1160705 RepID=L8PDB4_STRVR|nr:anthranilate phosphoribosyltransferase [Streptomyces viridochromogenes]ELS53312.1 putative Anthranilate phosphoribosyltransferase 2 [Streptomyces viridochromogenes Tue57]